MTGSPRELRERCLARQYGLAARDLRARFDLFAPEWVEGAGRLALARVGLLAACDRPTLPADLGAAAVVGAPCIDHCAGAPRGLTVQAFADLLYTLATARDLGLPALVTLGTREEELLLAAGRRRDGAAWREIGALVSEWVHSAARELGVGELRVWQTHEPDCDRRLTALAEETAELLSDRELEGLYSLDGASTFPSGSEVFAPYYAYFRRNVLSYLPEFTAAGLARPVETVVVAENVQQHKAVALARRLARQRAGGAGRVIHLAPLPTPSVDGASRMSRAAVEDQILIADPPATVDEKLAAAADTTVWYWRALMKDLGAAAGCDPSALLAAQRQTLEGWGRCGPGGPG